MARPRASETMRASNLATMATPRTLARDGNATLCSVTALRRHTMATSAGAAAASSSSSSSACRAHTGASSPVGSRAACPRIGSNATTSALSAHSARCRAATGGHDTRGTSRCRRVPERPSSSPARMLSSTVPPTVPRRPRRGSSGTGQQRTLPGPTTHKTPSTVTAPTHSAQSKSARRATAHSPCEMSTTAAPWASTTTKVSSSTAHAASGADASGTLATTAPVAAMRTRHCVSVAMTKW
mmetsp:Transcript_49860/g.154056  ORF Transcript_49860/g.154056 Transcript_49860/m.154056 type:complete len:240 (-) Transcript_49860:277-996(-)